MHWWEAGREGMSTCMIDGRRRHLCLYVLRLHMSNLGLSFWKSTVFFVLFVPYRHTHSVSPLCLYCHHCPSSIFLTPSLFYLQAHNKLWCSNAPGEFFFTLTTSPLSLPLLFSLILSSLCKIPFGSPPHSTTSFTEVERCSFHSFLFRWQVVKWVPDKR